jgi:4-amino-4-deoxy-L-arabinose transferase-like glycosyltransferase
LGIVAIVGLVWALVVPPWQSPDEVAHFAYAQSLAENFELPGDTKAAPYSTDQLTADAAVGASRGAFFPGASPPDWSSADYDAYLAAEHGADPPSRSNGSGPDPASQNPPLYYLYEDIGYLVDHGGTAFGRLYTMRITGVLLILLTTLATWLLIGEALGRRRLPQLAGAACAGLMPMATFMSTSVNPDGLLVALWTLALWLGVRVINRRAQGADVIALCAVCAAAILTKATSYALVPAVGLAIAAGWWRRPAPQRRAALVPISVAAAVLAVPVLAWLYLAASLGGTSITTIGAVSGHPFNVRQFVSYVWQFYLPRLPFMTPFRTSPQLPVYDIWVRQGVGQFGWLDVFEPGWVYHLAAIAGGAVAVAAGVITALRGRLRHVPLLSFLGLALVGLLGLLHISEYRVILANGGQFNQGRYLLPIIGLLGLAVALIISAVPRRLRAAACGLSVVALLLLQVISLTLVAKAYYL